MYRWISKTFGATIPIGFSYTQFDFKKCAKKVFCGEIEGTAAFRRYSCNKPALMRFFNKFRKIHHYE